MMQGKTCLVTGATSGIGRATALGLARKQARVVIVGRDPERTPATVAWLRQESGNQEVHGLLADLSNLTEARRVATAFSQEHDHLDVLVNNAGSFFARREITSDGFERTWALNHLAYVVLTLELLATLKANAPARIVNVASAMHTGRTIDFSNLQGEKAYSGLRSYGQSKLANVLFTYALARRLAPTGITVNCLHPGVVATGIMRQLPGPLRVLATVVKPFLLNNDQGAATSVHVATAPELEGVTGQYFDKCKPVASSPESLDQKLQERLWDLSLSQTGLTDPFALRQEAERGSKTDKPHPA